MKKRKLGTTDLYVTSTNFKLELLKEKPKDKQMVADLIAKE